MCYAPRMFTCLFTAVAGDVASAGVGVARSTAARPASEICSVSHQRTSSAGKQQAENLSPMHSMYFHFYTSIEAAPFRVSDPAHCSKVAGRLVVAAAH